MDIQGVPCRPYHAIGRWRRGRVQAVNLSARDLEYLHALLTYGALSTDLLAALVTPGAPRRRTSDRMHLLKNLPNEYVVQPEAQEFTKNANCTSLVYEISEKGVAALIDRGRISYADFVLWRNMQANFKPHHFDHDLTTAYILGSMQLGARETGVRLIGTLEILSRPKCPDETRRADNPLAIPYEANGERRVLIPDALFGLEYPAGACFFALETDMGTEQLKENDLKNSTLARKLRAYRNVIRDERYRARFALPSLQILIVTASVTRMHNIMDCLRRIADCDGKGSTHPFLFKALPEVARRTRDKLPTTGHMLTVPWSRVNYPQINLSAL